MFQAVLVPFIAFIAGTLAGFVMGWFIGCTYTQRHAIPNWERKFITVVVTFAWLVSVMLDIALSTYETPAAVHFIMGGVVGYFFETSIFSKK